MSDEHFRADAPARRRFGDFEVVERRTDSRLGPTHLARHTTTGTTAVVQVLAPAVRDLPGQRERLASEAELLTGLEHPNVVTVLGLVDEPGPAGDPGTVWLARQQVEGTGLDELLAGTELSAEHALGVLHDVLSGLVRLHHRGLVHRDLSPATILVSATGTTMVTDIGISVPRVDELGVPVTADPTYVAPEVAAGEDPTPASDVYAVGALAHHLLSGTPPYTGTTLELLEQHRHAPVPELLGHGPELTALVARCLAKDPEDRPVDAAALLAELELALRAPAEPPAPVPVVTDDTAVLPVVGGSRRAEPRSPGRRALVAVAGVLAGVVAVSGVVYGLTRDDGSQEQPEPGAESPAATTTGPDGSPSESPTDAPTVDPVVTSAPTGVWTVRSRFVESNNRAFGRKGQRAAPPRRWTFTTQCRDTLTCGGRIASDSGTEFAFTWDGSALRITRVPARFAGDVPCVNAETGDRVPESRVFLVQTYDYAAFEPRGKVDAETGMPTRFVGTATERWRYSRFRGGCTIDGIAATGARSPKVVTRFDVVHRSRSRG